MTKTEDFAGQPRVDGTIELVEFAGEEVIGAFHDDEAVLTRPGCDKGFDFFRGAEFVVASVDEEFWFVALVQERKIGTVYGNAEPN